MSCSKMMRGGMAVRVAMQRGVASGSLCTASNLLARGSCSASQQMLRQMPRAFVSAGNIAGRRAFSSSVDPVVIVERHEDKAVAVCTNSC